MKLNALPITFLLLPAIAACVEPEADLASDEQDITNAVESRAHEETVLLDVNPGSYCTGLAISPHWVLTAAHCTRDFTSGVRVTNALKVYSTNNSYDNVLIYGQTAAFADAMFIRHPSWDGSGTDKHDDVALIKLYGRGLDDGDTLDPFSARIFWDSREPWKSSYSGDRDFNVAGYGYGPDSCTDSDSDLVKRLGRFQLDPSIPNYSTSYTAKAQTPYGQDICPGDSGAPWLLSRTGWYAFAIHSGEAPTQEVGGQEFGTLIRPKMAWIESTAAARLPALHCANYVWAGWTYRQCDE